MKLSYFSNIKLILLLFGKGEKSIQSYSMTPVPKKNLIQDFDPWSFNIQHFLVIICTISVTLPNIILYCTGSCEKNRVLKGPQISFLYKNSLKNF